MDVAVVKSKNANKIKKKKQKRLLPKVALEKLPRYHEEGSEKVEIGLIQRGGTNFSSAKAIFTHDSKYICVCSGKVVKVVSVATGECVRDLIGHESIVTCVKTNPSNVLQVFSSSKDGHINCWDYQDGVLLKTYSIAHLPVSVFFVLSTTTQPVLIALEDRVVTKLELYTNKRTELFTLRRYLDSNKLSVGVNDTLVAATEAVGSPTICCYSLETNKIYRHTIKSRCSDFVSIQCHPTELCVCSGNQHGQIYVWWSVLDDNPVWEVIHWHTGPVNDLQFTTHGSYLLSGGDECVLVKWQHNDTEREFVPRLQAPILYLSCSPDNTTYALVLADNAIQFISSNKHLLEQYQGLTRVFIPRHVENPHPTGLILDPRTGALVLSGRPGHLQFYDLNTDRQLYNLDISCQNFVIADIMKHGYHTLDIVRAAIDVHGRYLATVEMWDDGVMSAEICLKFWHYIEQDANFCLTTSIDLPHNKAINNIEFRPTSKSKATSASLVSTSDDGKFKLWTLVNEEDKSHWICDSVGFYRDQPATTATFSEDGSVLAVSFASSITIWDPDTNAMKTILTQPDNDYIWTIAFGRHSCSHFLMSASTCQLTAWNLLSFTAEWSVSVNTSFLTVDPLSDVIAFFTTDRKLIVFRPSSAEPVYTISVRDIRMAIFIPRESDYVDDGSLPWLQTSCLYMMTRDQMLYVLSKEEERSQSAQHVSVQEANLPVPPMSIFIGDHRRSGVKDAPKMADIASTILDKSQDLFTGASHILPPASQLCSHFMKLLLDVQPQNKDSNESRDENDDEDMLQENSDSDDDDVKRDVKVNEDIGESRSAKQRTVSANDLVSIEQMKNMNFDWIQCSFEWPTGL